MNFNLIFYSLKRFSNKFAHSKFASFVQQCRIWGLNCLVIERLTEWWRKQQWPGISRQLTEVATTCSEQKCQCVNLWRKPENRDWAAEPNDKLGKTSRFYKQFNRISGRISGQPDIKKGQISGQPDIRYNPNSNTNQVSGSVVDPFLDPEPKFLNEKKR